MYVTCLLLTFGEREQCTDICMRQLVSALVEPVSELRGIVEMKSIQQRGGVKSRDAIRSILIDSLAKIEQIAVCSRRIEQQSIASRRDRLLTERGTQNVNCEVEQPACTGEILLRPKHRHRLVARDRLRPRRRNQRQQRDAVALGRGASEGSVASAKAGTAEQLDRDHARSS